MIIETKIDGIPCCVRLLHWEYFHGSMKDIHRWESPDDKGGWEIKYKVLDRKGYEAPWLERIMSEEDHEKIMSEFIEKLEYAIG